MKNKQLYYLVEGETEKKLIKELKNKYIYSGNIRVSNALNKQIPEGFLRTIPKNSVIVLIFDTDVYKLEMLEKNIKLIKKYKNVSDIIFIKQVYNFEDEIIYSTNIRNIKELLNSKSASEFKKDFLNSTNILKKLEEFHFSINKLWSKEDERYVKYKNEAYKIKINKK